MRIYEWRVYTLKSRESLEFYAYEIYPRHLESFKAFDIRPHGFFFDRTRDAHRLLVLCSYPEESDPSQIEKEYMSSPGFLTDMEGFDVSSMERVETTLLEPLVSSPLK